MIRHFIYTWLTYWAVVALLPVHSIYPATTAAFFLQLAFVLMVLASLESVVFFSGTRRMPEAHRVEIPSTPTLIRIAIAMSIVGLASLTYDKILIQGIDYSEGVAAAREEWRQLGEDRDGQASSIFSALGYLFGSAYFVAIVLAITQTRILSSRQRLWSLLASFSVLIGNSLITGGRSNVLLVAAFAIAAFSARRGLNLRNVFRRRGQRRILWLLVIAAAAYIIFIFYARAKAGGVEILGYAIDFLPYLGVEVDDWYRASLGGGIFSSLSAMLVLTLSYVTHSFATVAAIVDSPSEEKTIIFVHGLTILSKLNLVPAPDGDWFLSGRLASVPGALWHQFGIIGFSVGSFLLGVSCAIAKIWAARRPHRLLPLGAYVAADATLLLTPAFFAGDFLSFPFVVAAFVMLAFAQRLLGRHKRRPVLVSRPRADTETVAPSHG